MSLTDYEKNVRTHALLMGIAFLVVIPIGVLIARYLRTFTNRWWWAHWLINFIVAGPLIFTGWGMAPSANDLSGMPIDHHKTVGYVILGLYIAQIAIGLFIHAVRVPFLFIFHRPLQNYFHAILGLVILAMASYQIHDGIYTVWPFVTANIPPVKDSAKHAWLALLIIFWVLYFIGLAFLPRQYRQEREGSLLKQDKEAS
ncbi:hypothetical protein BGY98DRAFT_937179 [Russula aff. rugulosa BPL654]|nr:hypothetical protein BGY98DRAFT_937179 [Russula aff. rugulosa BPL654]